MHTDTMKGWCEDIFHLYCYSHDCTSTLYWVLYSGIVNLAMSQDVPVVGLTARCTGQGSPKYDLCMWSRALPTNLFLHGMSCDTLISHPGCLGKTAASIQGVDCHSQHYHWVINYLHLVILLFDHDPNPYSLMHRSARTWDLTINPCHFTS